jgi:hypothetical protein
MMPATSVRPFGEPSARSPGQSPPQRGRLDEVGEGPLAVDLDHRDRLAVGGFELGIAADVDRVEVLPADLAGDLERALAEVTALRVVDADAAQG